MVAIIADELSAADPANQSTYMANAAETTARLQQLDQELAATLAAVRHVPYVVFHDAYQYFEARYHLNAVGSITLNPEQAPGARRIYDIRERIAASGAVCIFSEPQFEPRLVATVVEGTDVKISVLDPVGAALTPGPDAYFSLMRQMAHALSDCLS
jgi:zinc transport system substrate-binding protein